MFCWDPARAVVGCKGRVWWGEACNWDKAPLRSSTMQGNIGLCCLPHWLHASISLAVGAQLGSERRNPPSGPNRKDEKKLHPKTGTSQKQNQSTFFTGTPEAAPEAKDRPRSPESKLGLISGKRLSRYKQCKSVGGQGC